MKVQWKLKISSHVPFFDANPDYQPTVNRTWRARWEIRRRHSSAPKSNWFLTRRTCVRAFPSRTPSRTFGGIPRGRVYELLACRQVSWLRAAAGSRTVRLGSGLAKGGGIKRKRGLATTGNDRRAFVPAYNPQVMERTGLRQKACREPTRISSRISHTEVKRLD